LTAEQQAIAVNWMHEMASLTKELAPYQLTALGTEVKPVTGLSRLNLLNFWTPVRLPKVLASVTKANAGIQQQIMITRLCVEHRLNEHC